MRYIFSILLFLFCFSVVSSQNIQLKQTGFQNSFGKIQMPSKNVVYILDDIPSTLLSSLDEGVTWDSIPLPSDSVIFRYDGFQFLTESIGFAWGLAGCHYTNGTVPALIKTVDHGKHWDVIKNNLPERGVINTIKFSNETDAICFMPCIEHNGHPEKYYTTDGGKTWSTINNYAYLYGEISQVEFIDGLNGFATGFNTNLFFSKTEDGGLTWYSNELNVMGGNGTGIKFFSATEGILISNDSIFKTYDAGDTWSKSKFPFSYNIAAFDFTDDGIGYFISDNNIYKTTDKCTTWELFYTNNDVYFSDIKINENVCYVSGTEGHVLKINLVNSTTANTIESSVKLYPNPSNGIAKVNYTVCADAHVMIELYDVLGQLVLNVINEPVAAGNYTLPIDISNLNSGIYFLKSNIGNSSKTTKIIKR